MFFIRFSRAFNLKYNIFLFFLLNKIKTQNSRNAESLSLPIFNLMSNYDFCREPERVVEELFCFSHLLFSPAWKSNPMLICFCLLIKEFAILYQFTWKIFFLKIQWVNDVDYFIASSTQHCERPFIHVLLLITLTHPKTNKNYNKIALIVNSDYK